MTKHKYIIPFFLCLLLFSSWIGKGDCQSRVLDNNTSTEPITGPSQAENGPGGMEYIHDSVAIFDYAKKPDGFWLYQPAAPVPTEAPVVVFIHGYGAYNPMIYGKWIKHLVKKGNIVVFPRYQKNLFSPSTDHFIDNTVTAIQDAIRVIDSVHQIKPMLEHFAMAGHSYGGVIAAGMAADYEKYMIPEPKAILLCSPGSGPFKGGVLDDYSGIPSVTKLVSMVSENDNIVGDKLGILIFESAINTPNRNLIRQYTDDHSSEHSILAGHNECYSIDEDLDTGIRNATARRALRISELNTLDYNGYWKIFDALLDCNETGEHCEMALGNTAEQRSLGTWSDGEVVRELEVFLPENTEK
ncbi:MAG: alpha/beta hydrolase [Saprospiraceae bacterium]